MTDLPDHNHFIRGVPWARVQKDNSDNPIGILPQAFELRDDEAGLSGNWLERVAGDINEQLKQHLKMMRTSRKLSSKARLAIVLVGFVKAIGKDSGDKLRIVHDALDGNEPHSEIRRLPRDDLRLLSRIADEAVITHVCCAELDALQL